MNIRQLIFFCRAARSGNFSVAAREEGVSVQAVSKSIHELEEEIGGQLFVRSGRGMRLTPLGRTLLEPALKTVESFDSDIRAQQVTYKVLKAHSEINCVYIAGAAVQGVGSALIANGSKDVFAIGFDELYSTRQLVSAGIIKFVVCQQPTRQGYHAIKRAYQAVAGQLGDSVPDFITDTIIKIKANLERTVPGR